MKKYIQPFIKVCKNVFKEFVGQDAEARMPYFMEKDEAGEWDISGIIGLTGEARGAVVISLKQELAIRLTSILTGAEYTKMEEDVVDAVGEMINIIAGNVKQELEDSYSLVISLPTIVRGKEHSINWPDSRTRVLCIPFVISRNDNFILSVALESAKG